MEGKICQSLVGGFAPIISPGRTDGILGEKCEKWICIQGDLAKHRSIGNNTTLLTSNFVLVVKKLLIHMSTPRSLLLDNRGFGVTRLQGV